MAPVLLKNYGHKKKEKAKKWRDMKKIDRIFMALRSDPGVFLGLAGMARKDGPLREIQKNESCFLFIDNRLRYIYNDFRDSFSQEKKSDAKK